jgi:predicted nucleic acid-binding protein
MSSPPLIASATYCKMPTRETSAKTAEEFLARVPSLPIRLVLPDEHSIVNAAKLKATRRISYADAFAAMLAQQEQSALITGDPELRALSDILQIEWLGAS